MLFQESQSSASGSNQSGVHMLMLSLKLPHSTWVGGLSSYRTQRYVCIKLLRTSSEEEPGLCPSLHCGFFLHSYTPPISNCLNLPFGTQGRSSRLKAFFLQTRNRDTERPLCLGGPHRVPPSFNIVLKVPCSCCFILFPQFLNISPLLSISSQLFFFF